MKNAFAVLVVFLCTPLLIASKTKEPASDVSGAWKVVAELSGPQKNSSLELKQDGAKLTGTYVGSLGVMPLTGTVQGRNVVIDVQAGAVKVHYAAKVEVGGKTMKGTVDFNGQLSGKFTATKKAVPAAQKKKRTK
jgi:hypothetical protein